jgi:hypothetical protein
MCNYGGTETTIVCKKGKYDKISAVFKLIKTALPNMMIFVSAQRKNTPLFSP